MQRLIRVTTIRRVPILVHWSVFALVIFFLGTGIQHIATATAGMAAYLAMLLIHELGHHYAAVHRNYHVDRIEVFPLHAVCRFEQPEFAADAAVIAWGGPFAQFVVAVPFIVYVATFGYTPFQPANAVLAILGFISPAIATFNLVPVAPLDGKKAWSLLPLLLPSRRRRKKPQKTALETLQEAVKKAKEQQPPSNSA